MWSLRIFQIPIIIKMVVQVSRFKIIVVLAQDCQQIMIV